MLRISGLVAGMQAHYDDALHQVYDSRDFLAWLMDHAPRDIYQEEVLHFEELCGRLRVYDRMLTQVKELAW